MQRINAIFILFIISPIWIIISVLIYILNGRPIFYGGQRVGKGFLEFKLYKFRTMHVNAGDIITVKNDSRITMFGTLLRKTRLDELPQLINIIKGDMSFVGPRPEVPQVVHENKVCFDYLSRLKPGVTDLVSILFKDEEKFLYRSDAVKFYIKQILPIKTDMILLFEKKNSLFSKLIIIGLTLLSFISYRITKKIIKFYFINNQTIYNNYIKLDKFI